MFYGITLLNVLNLSSLLGKMYEITLNLLCSTHCYTLPLICNDLSVECQLHKRIFKFVLSLLYSDNVYNKLLLNLALNGSGSRM